MLELEDLLSSDFGKHAFSNEVCRHLLLWGELTFKCEYHAFIATRRPGKPNRPQVVIGANSGARSIFV